MFSVRSIAKINRFASSESVRNASSIVSFKAREVIDSRGNPTVEVLYF